MSTKNHGRKLRLTRMTNVQRFAINLMARKETENAAACTSKWTDRRWPAHRSARSPSSHLSVA